MVYKTLHKKLKIELKTDGELRCSKRVTSSFSTSGNSHLTLVANPVMNYEPSWQVIYFCPVMFGSWGTFFPKDYFCSSNMCMFICICHLWSVSQHCQSSSYFNKSNKNCILKH